ncbi:MAG: YggT family protein [Acidobacteriota bacterium]|nr:YggT family protein [Acidobacteriota bacterium]
MLQIFMFVSLVVLYVVVAAIIGVALLVLLREIVNRADMNPFGWLPLNVRRWSDPLINPVRRGLARAGLDPKLASLVAFLVSLIFGYFGVKFFNTLWFTLYGVIQSITKGKPLQLVGSLVYGMLALYTLLIFMRIVFAWIMSSINPLLLLLIRLTEPVLAPFRRLIPPVGMFDLSPIIVIVLLQLLQEAVAGTLLAA